MKTKKLRLKKWVKQAIVIIIFSLLFFGFIAINNYLNNEMENHIEKVSQECAEQGLGITARYTDEGDKFYVCNN